MDKTIKDLVFNTIKMLSCSQGFYSRLWRDIRCADEDALEDWLEQFEGCKTELDVIYKLEC